MKITPSGKIVGAAIGLYDLVALNNANFGADSSSLPNHVPPHYWGTPVKGAPLPIPGVIRAADDDISPNGANNITFSYNGDSTKTELTPFAIELLLSMMRLPVPLIEPPAVNCWNRWRCRSSGLRTCRSR
jgi:hypothetical protein